VAGYMRGGRVEMLPRDKTVMEAGDKLVLLSDETGVGFIPPLDDHSSLHQLPRLTCGAT
jgi:hypothetical protein